MIAVNFPEANVQLAKDQPEYQTLPVLYEPTAEGVPMTCCFELSEDELKEINDTGKLWHTQWTFGHPFQPIRMSTKRPF